MKVALCFSGLARFWQKTVSFYTNNLLIEYVPDIFIHTWWDTDPFEHQKLIDTYQPKKVLVEPNNKIVLKRTYTHGVSDRYPAYNVFSFLKSIKECNRLKSEYEEENNFKYDWVFRLRLDYALNRTFNLEALSNEYIHVPMELSDRKMVTDQFAFSNSKNMNIYSSVYDYLDDYYDQGEPMIGEHMMTYHLKSKGIYDRVVHHDMNHPFNPIGTDSMINSLIRKQMFVRDPTAINKLNQYGES